MPDTALLTAAPVAPSAAQRTATTAAYARQLTNLAGATIRGHRPDLALVLLQQAGMTLAGVQADAPDVHAADLVATARAGRFVRVGLTDPDRAALDALTAEDRHDTPSGGLLEVDDEDEGRPLRGDVDLVAAFIAHTFGVANGRARRTAREVLAELAVYGRLTGADGTRDANGDRWTCSLHGGALTQDCACLPAYGLGDLDAATLALWQERTRGHYGDFDTLDPEAQDSYREQAARIVLAYHRAGTAAEGTPELLAG